jgi:hypothetical protein
MQPQHIRDGVSHREANCTLDQTLENKNRALQRGFYWKRNSLPGLLI